MTSLHALVQQLLIGSHVYPQRLMGYITRSGYVGRTLIFTVHSGIRWLHYIGYMLRFRESLNIIHVQIFVCRSLLIKFSRANICLAKVQNWFEEHSEFQVLQIPQSSNKFRVSGMCWTKTLIIEIPPHDLQKWKDLLLPSWCQISQHSVTHVQASGLFCQQNGDTQY